MKKFLIILFLLSACSFATPQIIRPIETKTVSGQVITQVPITKTGNRSNIPVNIKPTQIEAHFAFPNGMEIWVVRVKGEIRVFLNDEAIAASPQVDIPKKSYTWLYITIGIIVLLIGANFALKSFLGFNPIAWVGQRIFKVKK